MLLLSLEKQVKSGWSEETENTLFYSCIRSKPSTRIVYFSFSLCLIGRGASEWGAYWWCTIELAVLSFVSSESRIFLQWIQFILFCCFSFNVIDIVVVIIIFMKCCRIVLQGSTLTSFIDFIFKIPFFRLFSLYIYSNNVIVLMIYFVVAWKFNIHSEYVLKLLWLSRNT